MIIPLRELKKNDFLLTYMSIKLITESARIMIETLAYNNTIVCSFVEVQENMTFSINNDYIARN